MYKAGHKVKRNFRLTRSSDIKRVKKQGKSFAHPLLVLIKEEGIEGHVRIGISAGRSIGNAVKRNRAKRRMRASLNSYIDKIQPGWDLLFLARKPITDAPFDEVLAAEEQLLKRAKIIRDDG